MREPDWTTKKKTSRSKYEIDKFKIRRYHALKKTK